MLKALKGGNSVTAELKNSDEVLELASRFNAVIDSNVRLIVHLQGDIKVRRRRLKVVRCAGPEVERPIADLAGRILREEAPGVLNFALDGTRPIHSAYWSGSEEPTWLGFAQILAWFMIVPQDSSLVTRSIERS